MRWLLLCGVIGVSCHYINHDTYNDKTLWIQDEGITGFNDIWLEDTKWDRIKIITLKNKKRVIQKCMENKDFCLCRRLYHKSKHQCYSTAAHQSLSNILEMSEMMGGNKRQKTGHNNVILPDGSRTHSFVKRIYPDPPPLPPPPPIVLPPPPPPPPHARYYVIVAHGGFSAAFNQFIPSTLTGDIATILSGINMVFYWQHCAPSVTTRGSVNRDDRVYQRLTGTGIALGGDGKYIGMPKVYETVKANTINQPYIVTNRGAARPDLGGWRVLYVEQQTAHSAPHVVATVMNIAGDISLAAVLLRIHRDATQVRNPPVPLPIHVHWIACRVLLA